MAYQTGTVASLSALRTVMETFCTSNGWTLLGTDVLNRGNVYVRLVDSTATQDHIRLYGGDGVDGSNLLTGSHWAGSLWTKYNNIDVGNPFTYHLFMTGDNDNFFCIINYATSYIRYMCFGTLVKYGIYTGGEYFAASNSTNTKVSTSTQMIFDFTQNPGGRELHSGGFMSPSPLFPMNGGTNPAGYLRCDLHSPSGDDWLSNNTATETGILVALAHQITVDLSRAALNTWNNEAILVPYYIATHHNSNDMSILGHMDQIRSTRVENYNIGDLVTLGSDQWMLFPWYKRSFTQPNGQWEGINIDHSGVHGFAIRYEP